MAADAPGAGEREEALQFLLDRINYERSSVVAYEERSFKLDRMRELLSQLGDPQSGMPIVHVAGTKGKGSTAAMVSSVLTSAGYRVGLFSSPHLHDVEERIRIDGQPVSAVEFVQLVERIRPVVCQMDALAGNGKEDKAPELGSGPTYFELTTALALVHFFRQQVDLAVLEVGMGGRLDSTNVCQAAVSVITNISLDHVDQLGTTRAAIAAEKAGIVKPGVPVVSGVLDDEPRQVIRSICQQRQSPLIELGRDFEFDYQPATSLDLVASHPRLAFRYFVPGQEHHYQALELGLLGRHQAANAAVALAVLAELRRQGWCISHSAASRGLAEIRWPARMELLGRGPAVVVDAAHNVASVEAVLTTLDESFAARRRVLVFATSRDKDVPEMLRRLLPRFDEVVFCRYGDNPRGIAPEELDRLAAQLSDTKRHVCPDADTAWRQARRLAGPKDLVCITGSFFLAAAMRRLAVQEPISRPGAVA